MLLRASSELRDESADLRAITDPAAAATSGVPDGDVLLGFVDASCAGDAAALARAREALRSRLGDAATVDAAAVIGNFQRMVRIADGAGIPLDGTVAFMSAEVRDELDLDRFGSAAHTPAVRGAKRLAAKLAQPLLRFAIRRFAPR